EVPNRGADARLDRGLLGGAAPEPVENVGDPIADLAELGGTEAARRPGRAAEAKPGGDRRLLLVERHRVLVAGYSRPLEALRRDASLEAVTAQVEEHDRSVGAPADDVVSPLRQAGGERTGIGEHGRGIGTKLRL